MMADKSLELYGRKDATIPYTKSMKLNKGSEPNLPVDIDFQEMARGWLVCRALVMHGFSRETQPIPGLPSYTLDLIPHFDQWQPCSPDCHRSIALFILLSACFGNTLLDSFLTHRLRSVSNSSGTHLEQEGTLPI